MLLSNGVLVVDVQTNHNSLEAETHVLKCQRETDGEYRHCFKKMLSFVRNIANLPNYLRSRQRHLIGTDT